jgi:hypothetical protein
MMSLTRKCPHGYIRRRGYTRRNTGKYVRSVCIRSTSAHATKPMNHSKTMRRRLGSVLGTRKACPPGKIARKAYVRRLSSSIARKGFLKRTRTGKTIRVHPKVTSTFVPASCVKDTGKKGKLPEGAPKIGPLRKGELAKHGYSYKVSEATRQNALRKAIGEFGALSTYRKLDAVAKLTERTNPMAAKVFKHDRNWIQTQYAEAGKLRAF